MSLDGTPWSASDTAHCAGGGDPSSHTASTLDQLTASVASPGTMAKSLASSARSWVCRAGRARASSCQNAGQPRATHGHPRSVARLLTSTWAIASSGRVRFGSPLELVVDGPDQAVSALLVPGAAARFAVANTATEHRSEPPLVALDRDKGRVRGRLVVLGLCFVVVLFDQPREDLPHWRSVRKPRDPCSLVGMFDHVASIDEDGAPQK